MIVYDLRCAGAGHVFEAWFGSGEDYDSQRGRGLVICPICGDPDVAKAVVAPRLGTHGGRADPGEVKAVLAKLAAVQRRLLENSQDVGRRFADEARAIHLGEAEQRSIHGQASAAEAAELAAEGVPVARLPLPVVEAGQEN